MEFKGTKGKWQVTTDNEEGCLVSVMNPINRDVCTVWKYDINFLENQEAIANALLISKAPEMLELLNDLAYGDISVSEAIEKAKQLIKEATEL